MPSGIPAEIRRVVDSCQQAGLQVKVLPATADILDGNVSFSRVRDIDPSDLLGRRPAKLDMVMIKDFISSKRVLVTGGAGSVGSELARHLASLEPERLVLVDHAENSLFFLESELSRTFPDASIVFQVDDITDQVAVRRLMDEHQPHLVLHAAAYKHVPLMERAPVQAVRNNVWGTYCVATSAVEAGVGKFVLVSTDKAVNPISVMGGAKRLAEMVVQEMNESHATRLISVRFGNVLDSAASVVPIFKRQIAEGGPVTVTHADARRYFMSIPEAAGLILQAAAAGSGGEILALDMGEPIGIVDLAEMVIRLSGLEPYDEMDIVFTGLRPGEKISEELSLLGQEFKPTPYEKLMVLEGDGRAFGILSEVDEFLSELTVLTPDQVRSRLQALATEYQPTPGVAQDS